MIRRELERTVTSRMSFRSDGRRRCRRGRRVKR